MERSMRLALSSQVVAAEFGHFMLEAPFVHLGAAEGKSLNVNAGVLSPHKRKLIWQTWLIYTSYIPFILYIVI